MATTRIKDLSKTATTVNSDANLVLDGNTGGTQKISRDNFRQDTADAFVAAPGTYNLAPLNSGTGKIDAVYLSSTSDSPKGAWNASTNTPTLADGSGTAGDYYDVTVAGSSDLGSGSIAFTVGDVVKYNGTVWFKIDSVANILDGVSTIDGAKTAIEIPDVGTAPNEVPLNGMLGDMAYQSSEGISVGTATIDGDAEIGATSTDHTRLTISSPNNKDGQISFDDSDGSLRGFVIYDHAQEKLKIGSGGANAVYVDSSQRVGINQTSPGSYANSNADDLVVGNGGEHGITIYSGSANNGRLFFSDGTGTDSYRGIIRYDHGSNQLVFGTNSNDRWTINSSGNLVSSGGRIDIPAGGGIYFNNTSDAAGATSEILDDFETGTWSPVFAPQSGSFASITMVVTSARYTKIGNRVIATCYINTNGLNTSGGSGPVTITGLPFSAVGFNAVAIGYAVNWIGHPAGGYTQDGTSYVILANRTTSISGPVSAGDTSNLNTAAGQQNNVMISVTYTTA